MENGFVALGAAKPFSIDGLM